MVKYSFIVPVYNGEKYIEKCINSILEIQMKDYEIVIVNDGSTDKTQEIIDRICTENKTVKNAQIKPSGLSVARNSGLELAKGKYIIFIDADDWFNCELKNVFDVLKKQEDINVLYYTAQSVVEDENMKIYAQQPYKVDFEKIYSGNEVLRLAVNYNFPHEAWRGIYSRSFLIDNKLSFKPGLLYEDNVFWLEIMQKAEKIMFSNIVAYNYLIRANSIVRSVITEKNVKSVFDNIKVAFENNCRNEGYLVVAAHKMLVLLKSCEYMCPTKNRDRVISQFQEFKEIKEDIISLIDDMYDENIPNLLKAKYLLLSNIVFFMGVYSDEMVNRVKILRRKIISYFELCFSDWNLSSSNNKRLGIYGKGRCSDFLLNTYEKLIGEIKNDIYYIDSYLDSNIQRHYNRNIINVADLNKYNIYEIFVASNIFEKEMVERVRECDSKINIHRFFGKDNFAIEGIITQNFYEVMRNIIKTENKKRIFLIGTPEYQNVGDHLITLAEYQFLKKYYPDYYVIEITNEDYMFNKLRLKNLVKSSDLLMITGGGFLGSIWFHGHFNEVLDLIEAYQNNKIIIMPQSIYFSDDSFGKDIKAMTQRIFDRCDLKVCLRDIYSYERMRALGTIKCEFGLFPDIALFYKNKQHQNKRIDDRVGWFLRQDKESIITPTVLNDIKEVFINDGKILCESTMQYDSIILKENRQLVVDEKLGEISTYELVVTDQLHCMISCYLTKTPCIALNNISKKVDGVYQWIKGCDYIFVADKPSEIKDIYKKIKIANHEAIDTNIESNDWDKLFEFINM